MTALEPNAALPIFDELCESPAVLADAQPPVSVLLPFAERERSRLRVTLADGTAVGIKLPRGTLLRHGQWLCSTASGSYLQICAAPEPVSTVYSDAPETLARAAYHLGNRHVWVQIGPGWVRYLRDSVLDHMLQHLGLDVHAELEPFDPEAGAYAGSIGGAPAGHGHAH